MLPILLLLLASCIVLSAQRCANIEVDTQAQPMLPSVTQRHIARQSNVTEVDVYFHIASTEANEHRITDQTVSDQVSSFPVHISTHH